MAKSRFKPPSVCPVCGEDVPPKALACPECGADEESGWKEGAMEHGGLDLPEEEFDYDSFVADEFGIGKKQKSGKQIFWWVVAVLILLGLICGRFLF
jgi:predicted nucleic acid-binding Zn ribbon protein